MKNLLLSLVALAFAISLSSCYTYPPGPVGPGPGGPGPGGPGPGPGGPGPGPGPAQWKDYNNPNVYVGMPIKKATERAMKNNRKWRVTKVNGVSKPMTLDYRPTRINFEVVNGRVTSAKFG